MGSKIGGVLCFLFDTHFNQFSIIVEEILMFKKKVKVGFALRSALLFQTNTLQKIVLKEKLC